MSQRKTIALVHGRDSLEAARPLCETARELGFDLIILDQPGHWILQDEYQHLYSKFEPLDMTIDDGLPDRIVSALRPYNVDGICTVSDRCLLPVSKAAKKLGLPTESPEAFERSIDKSQTRMLNREDVDFLIVQDVSQLQERMPNDFVYPMVVKPAVGWSSEYVFKVQDDAGLLLAAKRVASQPNGLVLVETYVDGPEVDANFVLCNGELLFTEISDDFPSPADSLEAGVEADFFETGNVLPSALPNEEQKMIRSQLQKILLEVGFQTGVFHLEARVMNSRMEYTSEDGYLDLRSKSECRKKLPKCFLIEINPRPPGFQSVYATKLTYGVDYFALHMLRCVNDLGGFTKLASSSNVNFRLAMTDKFWCEIVFIAGNKGGICQTADGYSYLIKRQPHLKQSIAMGMSFFKRGDLIPDSTTEKLVFLGFFLVTSTVSRATVRRAAEEVRREFRLDIIRRADSVQMANLTI